MIAICSLLTIGRLKIIEGWGTGLPRLFRQCRERGLPEPKFEEFGDGIKVTIYRRSGSEWVNGTTQSTTQTTQLPDGRKMSDIEIRIVDAMKENSKITQSKIGGFVGQRLYFDNYTAVGDIIALSICFVIGI